MAEEVTPAVISETQSTLGKYVSKPPLTEKLLKKPPFRFLHDVINAVVKETGFLKGLFSDGDLLSDNIKDREAKVAFLNKLITAVKTISGIDLQVRASKIIAGLEPVETNKLLQAIGTCIDKKIDSKEYINQLKGKSTKSKSKEPEKVKKTTSKSSVKSTDSRTKKTPDTPKTKLETPKTKTVDTPKLKSTDTPKTKTTSKTKDAVSKKSSKTDAAKGKTSKDSLKPEKKTREVKKSPRIPELKLSPKPAEIVSSPKVETPKVDSPKTPKTPKMEDIIETNTEEEIIIEPEVKEEPKPIERPKSARPRSGDFKQKNVPKIENEIKNLKEIEIKKEIDIKNIPEVNNVVDNKIPEMKKEIEKKPELIMRPKSSLRPPSVRPSSARPGAPRLRPESALPIKEMVPLGKINVIVENFNEKDAKDDDEEETVVIQNIPEEMPDPIMIEKSLDMPADKGHLVEQILEQIQAPEQLEEQVKGTIDWEQESTRGRDATSKEINQLRASIQSLTRTANPLGKLMSYLHEDVEAMHSELDTWTKMKRQFTAEIAKQKRVNMDSNQPLINQLRELEENITKQREEIALVRFNVLRNEERIRDLVGKQIISQ